MSAHRPTALLVGVVSNAGLDCKTGLCSAFVSKRLAKPATRKPVRRGTSSFSARLLGFLWLGSRDSNPNYLIQSQASYR